MIRLVPSAPPGCDVHGRIYWDANPAVLGEDMLDVMLPSGVLISCGWYPEGDSTGAFRITVSEGFEELRRVETRKVSDAFSIVQSLIREFYGNQCVSRSISSSLDVSDLPFAECV